MNPMLGPNRLKLGTFASNADGGLSLTTVPERWTAAWDDCLAAAKIADEAGLDFLLPIARWQGFGGATRAREWSFETLTWASALAAATSRIALFSTVHVPLIHPLFAAKALATIDHVSHGRAGLNIVCGWNPSEFGMFGMTLDDNGYERAAEWLNIIETLYAADGPIDYDGRFYQLRQAITRPVALQTPRPVTMNAAFSPPGRDFAAKACDQLFTTFSTIEEGKHHIEDIAGRAASTGREVGVSTVCHVVCRPTDAEAQAYYNDYALVHADHDAVEQHMSSKRKFSGSHDDQSYRLYRQRFAGGAGSYPLVGSPETVAEQMAQISEAGFSAIALSFVNYREELPYFCQNVLPLLAERGLRDTTPLTQAA
ncbi:LLM class flavin-dependent oxidoreductase [Novosphingobium sp. P6W]|uniref:LLM class flavin-dependent oxidoreductase n=1 Tax=Novosphingobium sp. P6W TaxID=1609758 RepID=UPI0005C30840|nr:LLM class flavin-dependent oxidoreductase [Novosphingobium sp. P6W]AXB80133.1 LLM class flavin-dependent oxidoreductase [Novosphingobium sp. P6W]KIS29362.1 alkanesulfonate monooxygenase [Novosphingobium sp. P6W]